MSRPSSLTVVVPHLRPPRPIASALAQALAPIAALFTRAEQVFTPWPSGSNAYAQSGDAMLAQLLGLPQPLPVAALESHESHESLGQQESNVLNPFILRADPVHLYIKQDSLTLVPMADADLSWADATELVAHLTPHLALDGMTLTAHTPTRWTATLPTPVTPTALTPLTVAAGRSVFDYLPQSNVESQPDSATLLRQNLTEVQMLLFEHPVNQRRQAQGLPPINSLWYWGAGAYPAPPAAGGLVYQALVGASPLAEGIARWAGLAYVPTLGALSGPIEARQPVLVLDDTLTLAALMGDTDRYQQQLSAVVLPLLEQSLQLAKQSVTFIIPADDGVLTVKVTPQQRWQFWRSSINRLV